MCWFILYSSLTNASFSPSSHSVPRACREACCAPTDEGDTSRGLLRPQQPSTTPSSAACADVGAPECLSCSCATGTDLSNGDHHGSAASYQVREGEHLAKHLAQAQLERGSTTLLHDDRLGQDRQRQLRDCQVCAHRSVLLHMLVAYMSRPCWQESVRIMGGGGVKTAAGNVDNNINVCSEPAVLAAGASGWGGGLGRLPFSERVEAEGRRDSRLCSTSGDRRPPHTSGGGSAAQHILPPRGDASGAPLT